MRSFWVVSALCLSLWAPAAWAGLLVNENRVNDGLVEFYVSTDKATYSWGDVVQVTQRLTNNGTTTADYYTFWDFGLNMVVKQNGITVFEAITGRSWAFRHHPLSPGEILEKQYTWDMGDVHGGFVCPGIYDVHVTVDTTTPHDLSVPITIVPEPSSSVLILGAALLGLRRRRRD